jgi:hypothetical protein
VAEPEALIFLHVPKTAGSSLSAILEEQYTRERSYSTSFSGHRPSGSLDGFHALPPARVGAAAVPILALPPAAGQQASCSLLAAPPYFNPILAAPPSGAAAMTMPTRLSPPTEVL